MATAIAARTLGSAGRRQDGARRTSRIASVPERFAKPRILLLLAVFALTAFGLLMIYSSSSIEGLLNEDFGNDPSHYLTRQLVFVAAGVAAAAVIAVVDYHVWSDRLVSVAWLGTLALLVVVRFTSSGTSAYGATRWIQIGSFTLQPSEFTKVTVVLVTAALCQRYFEDHDYDWDTYLRLMLVGLGAPLLLVVLQPDKGTTMICAATVVAMLYLSGVPGRTLAFWTGVGAVLFLLYSLRDDYSRARILTMLNPWRDPYDSGYQLVQGFYAFGSGGLLGVGIGSSRQKYSYLPMPYNDFIYAIVGEECGLVGTLGVVAGFALIVWAGFRIARYAPDLSGRLIAAGSVSMLAIQMLVNVLGVLGAIPLSGKPVPFLSYGGSSVISCMMLVGLVLSVSRASRLEETESDRRRSDLSVTSRPRPSRLPEDGLVGEATPRSARAGRRDAYELSSYPNLRLVEGGMSARPAATPLVGATRASRLPESARTSTDSAGRVRIDLGPDATERLRGRRGTAATNDTAPNGRSRRGR